MTRLTRRESLRLRCVTEAPRNCLRADESCYVDLDVQMETRGNGRVERVRVSDLGEQAKREVWCV